MNSDTVDYEDSCLIVRYLASMRPFAQSFDIYLTQVRHYCLSISHISDGQSINLILYSELKS